MRIRAIAAVVALSGLFVGVAHAQIVTQTSASRALTPGITVYPGTSANQVDALTAAQTQGYQQQGQVQPQQTNAQRAAANDAKMQKASTPSATPPTAFEQGYGNPGAADAARALADYQELHSARQEGRQVFLPLPANTVASQPALRGWFANWKDTLTNAGVDDRKINFEAARLNQDEFARWASRLVRATNPSLDEVPTATATSVAAPSPVASAE